ncbi:MAG TPA: hypothetical protein PLY87_28050 [Planctomycetaceae bacterium]|nr:hypothetical protein [Planctomycetaceae bacterium]
MRKFWGITWRAVGVSPPSYPHLTRRAYAAPLAGFAATWDVTPLIVRCLTQFFHSLSACMPHMTLRISLDPSTIFKLESMPYNPCLPNLS